MSADDAKRAVGIGATAIMVSNHGGRQLDGSRSPFDQISEIADAVGGKVDIICDGGIRRGSHVLKTIAAGATACSGGRLYLYALAAAGQPGVERIVGKLRDEIERDMKLMGVRSVACSIDQCYVGAKSAQRNVGNCASLFDTVSQVFRITDPPFAPKPNTADIPIVASGTWCPSASPRSCHVSSHI